MPKLQIPILRRFAGASLSMLCFVFGAYFALGHEQSRWLATQVSHTLPLDLDAAEIALLLLGCGAITTPTLLYPCLFDRFPSFFARLPPSVRSACAALLGVA